MTDYYSKWCERINLFYLCSSTFAIVFFGFELLYNLNRMNEPGFWLVLGTIPIFLLIIIIELWSSKPNETTPLTETCTFQVSYHGTEEAVKTVDLTESFEGLEGAIKTAYHLLTDKPESDVTVKIHELPGQPSGVRAFMVDVTAEHNGRNVRSLKEVVGALGFLG